MPPSFAIRLPNSRIFAAFGPTAVLKALAILFVVIGVMGIVGAFVGWREILIERRVFRVLPLVAFGYIGLQAIRNGNHFALVYATLTSWNFAAAFAGEDDAVRRDNRTLMRRRDKLAPARFAAL